MSSSLQPEVLNWGGVWMCVGTISIVSTIDRIQLIVCVCFFNKKMTRIKTDNSEKNTSFHFPHRLWDKDSLFDEKSNSPDSSGDVSVYLFVFLAPSQSPHARDKRGEEKSSNHAREKQKQPSRSSAFSTIGCESVRWLRPEWLRATGGCWNKLIQVCDCSSRPAPPQPPPPPPLHMDHLGDLFMEPIPASGSELIRATHACFV